jgi:hypothetical protein
LNNRFRIVLWGWRGRSLLADLIEQFVDLIEQLFCRLHLYSSHLSMYVCTASGTR